MIQVTLTVTASQLAAIAAIMGAEAAEPAAKAAPRKQKVFAEVPEAPAETAKGAEVKGKDADGEEVAEVPSESEVTAAAKALVAKNGRDALAELLRNYGAKQLSGLPEDKRTEFIEACNAQIA